MKPNTPITPIAPVSEDRQKPIFLVEDNRDDAELAIRAFRKNYFSNEIIVARDGAEAIELLLGESWPKSGELPAVVLLDLKLPKLNGVDVLRRLRAHPRTRLLPVVLFTSSAEERDIVEGYSAGANAYVRKPLTFEQLVENVRHMGEFWTRVNVPPPRLPDVVAS